MQLTKNPETANDIHKDHIHIIGLIFMKYCLLILKILIQVSLVTFFIGNIIYILIDLSDDMDFDHEYMEAQENRSNIIGSFSFYSLNYNEKSIKMTYWIFTTLSTVGFGDIHPKSNFERILSALIMLIGVLVFSYVKDIFISIIDFTMHIDEDFDEGIELTRFMGTIRRFNYYVEMDRK
jgi:hypothetical protein